MLNRFKGSPRPWNIKKTILGEIAIASVHYICTLPMLVATSAIGKEYESNAHLISTAPDLLEYALLQSDWNTYGAFTYADYTYTKAGDRERGEVLLNIMREETIIKALNLKN